MAWEKKKKAQAASVSANEQRRKWTQQDVPLQSTERDSAGRFLELRFSIIQKDNK